MSAPKMFYEFTEQRKTFFNRGVGFYAFTHLQGALYVCVCVHGCACTPVHTCARLCRVNA